MLTATVQDQPILDVDARRTLYFLVQKNPGYHFRELQRKSNLAVAVVKHHLDYLVKHGLLKVEKDGRRMRYYAITITSTNRKLFNLLRQLSSRKILLVLLEQKKTSFKIICTDAQLAPSTVSEQLKKLEQEGIVGFVKQKQTEYVLLVDANEVVKLLITYRSSFLDVLVDRVIDMWEF